MKDTKSYFNSISSNPFNFVQQKSKKKKNLRDTQSNPQHIILYEGITLNGSYYTVKLSENGKACIGNCRFTERFNLVLLNYFTAQWQNDFNFSAFKLSCSLC